MNQLQIRYNLLACNRHARKAANSAYKAKSIVKEYYGGVLSSTAIEEAYNTKIKHWQYNIALHPQLSEVHVKSSGAFKCGSRGIAPKLLY